MHSVCVVCFNDYLDAVLVLSIYLHYGLQFVFVCDIYIFVGYIKEIIT